MTGQQRKMLGVMVVVVVAGIVFMGVRSNRRAAQAERDKVQEASKAAEAKRRTKPVVFARDNIERRTEIRKEWLEVKEVEERDVPKLEYATSLDEVVGKIALTSIYHGEPLLKVRFTDKDQVTALSFVIPRGMRAVSLKVNTVDACGGFVKQGDRVDILATFALTAKNASKRVTTYLMEDVKVLAMDKVYQLEKAQQEAEKQEKAKDDKSKGANNPYQARASVSYITFLVSPSDAELLTIASARAKLKLLLRPEATGTITPDGKDKKITIDETAITGAQATRTGSDKKETQVRVEVFKGLAKGEQYLSLTEDKATEPPPPPGAGPGGEVPSMPEVPEVPDLPTNEDFGGVELPDEE